MEPYGRVPFHPLRCLSAYPSSSPPYLTLDYIKQNFPRFSFTLFFSICCLFWNNFTIIEEKVKWHRESHVSYPWPESGQLVGNSVLCGGSCWNKTQMAHLPGREGTHKKTEDVGRNDSFIQTVSRQMERSQGFSMLKERVLFLNCTTLVHFQFPHTWEGLDQGR